MADRVMPGALDNQTRIREAVCVDTRKIFDSCRDKDCVEDLRVYLTNSSLNGVDSAISIRPRSAELLGVDVDVDEITFNRGYYTVDCKFYYKVKGVVFPSGQTISGFCTFDKRVILFGSEARAKTFTSNRCNCTRSNSSALPTAVVEAVDPINLGMRIVEPQCCSCDDNGVRDIPEFVRRAFDDDLMIGFSPRQVVCTLGQFSIIRLERDTQLVMPVYDYCLPEKECAGGNEDDPCSLFSTIPFPVDEFFPPDSCGFTADYRSVLQNLN